MVLQITDSEMRTCCTICVNWFLNMVKIVLIYHCLSRIFDIVVKHVYVDTHTYIKLSNVHSVYVLYFHCVNTSELSVFAFE